MSEYVKTFNCYKISVVTINYFLFYHGATTLVGQGLLIIEDS